MEGVVEEPTTDRPPDIAAALARKHGAPQEVFDHFGEGADLIVGLGNGEPVTVIDALEEGGERLSGVTIHQMFPLRERRYMHGDIEGLRHVSWYLSPANREAFHKGECDLVPNNFCDVPRHMKRSTRRSLGLAAASPPDRHGYFSLGTHAEYMAPMIAPVSIGPAASVHMGTFSFGDAFRQAPYWMGGPSIIRGKFRAGASYSRHP
jgi:acyl-CoA hydrolase